MTRSTLSPYPLASTEEAAVSLTLLSGLSAAIWTASLSNHKVGVHGVLEAKMNHLHAVCLRAIDTEHAVDELHIMLSE